MRGILSHQTFSVAFVCFVRRETAVEIGSVHNHKAPNLDSYMKGKSSFDYISGKGGFSCPVFPVAAWGTPHR
ncbi:hypothetical protein GQ43DRAFT_442121 [Delitschia confertaspora ATCC 74209]|uniref:Uncharacterized protein n=1 Tax=Delitschia confertaspora ATCC 74209 TaxID=1513339 RepID=A0A9P4JI44_9PLEO|nr:hypothetical protein GQ43DRAFT_444398 [Delitschia confertaspora ATCC 74209]KAF2199831.1 hypothetical protein GQ43DRAFT_442121 [Delitschia confertaspora ATCC 74209]